MKEGIYALVLAGGRSSRMRTDKAALQYDGRPQLARTFELAARHSERCFVSVRDSQRADPARSGYPLLVDSASGEGPMVGIRSAMAAHPDKPWLVIACDLPFLSDTSLGQLASGRDPTALATAFKSVHDGLPEPLCAIWEPRARALLDDAAVSGRDCPRKFLIRNGAHLLDPADPHALDNVNTPEEYAQAIAALGVKSMKLKIQYFALLREQAGRSEETLETLAATPADLYGELVLRYGFTLLRDQLKVAVNSEFADWSYRLAAGDAVVFIPPVAGG